MTTTYTPLKKNVANQVIMVAVFSQTTGQFKANPTIAAGDFQRSIGGAAFQNMDSLPVVTPTGGCLIAITLSAVEVNADYLDIVGHDAAGAEWDDVHIHIPLTSNPLEDLSTQISGLATAADVADAVFEETSVGHTGTIPTNLDAKVSTRSVLTVGDLPPDPDNAGIAAIEAVMPGTVVAAKADLPPSGTMVNVHLLTTPVVPASLPITANHLICRRGDDFSWPITGLGSLAGYDKLYFTVKRTTDDPDGDSIAQIYLTAVTGGLLVLNGDAGTLTDGSIVIDDLVLGNITINIKANATKEFDVGEFSFDVEMIKSGVVSTLAPDGIFTVLSDSTRRVT